MTRQFSKTHILVECAILAALAFALAYVSDLFPFRMPLGGTITFFSSAPIIIASIRHGIKWGIPTALVFSFAQLLMGLKNFTYLPNSFWPVVGCAMLDYILAFTVIGLAGALYKCTKSQTKGIILAVLVTGFGRLFFSFLSGILLWGAFVAEDWTHGLVAWSLAYNAAWCVPDVILALIAVLVLTNVKPLKLLPNKNA
jgi:Predicted membrane protein